MLILPKRKHPEGKQEMLDRMARIQSPQNWGKAALRDPLRKRA